MIVFAQASVVVTPSSNPVAVPCKGLRNSEIRFGIGILETEPYTVPNYVSNSEKSEFRLFQISEFLTFYGICYKDEMFFSSVH